MITAEELKQLTDDLALPVVISVPVSITPKPYKEAYKRAKQRDALYSLEAWLDKLVESKRN